MFSFHFFKVTKCPVAGMARATGPQLDFSLYAF